MRAGRQFVRAAVFTFVTAILAGCQQSPENSKSEPPKTRVKSLSESGTTSTKSSGRAKLSSREEGHKSSSAASLKADAVDETFTTTGPHTIVTGRVLLPNGSPAGAANVQLSGYDYNEETGESSNPVVAETSTTAEGKFKLAGRGLRMHVIKAQQKGYATAQKTLQDKTPRAWDAALPPLRKYSEDLTLLEAVSLQGKVVDEADQPVAGASIQLTGVEIGKLFATDSSTSSTASGEFSLEDIAVGQRTLLAESPRHVPLSQRVSIPTSEPLVLRLKTGGAIVQGLALMKGTGEALSSVSVVLNYAPKDYKTGPRYSPFKATTNASGAYEIARLPAGRYRLEAGHLERGLGLAPMRPESATLEIADKETTEVNLLMYGGHSVSGIVMDKETSQPIEGAKISIQGRVFGGRKKNVVVSGADGSYRATGLLPYGGASNVGFNVQKTGYKLADRNNNDYVWVQVDPDDTEAQKDIPMLRSVTVSGLIKTKDGVPVPTATVSIFDRNNWGNQREGSPAGPDGKYLIEVSRYSMFRVKASAAGFPAVFSDAVQVDDKNAENVDITLEPGGTVAGTVVDPNGNPVEGADVTGNQAVQIGNMGGSDSSGSAKSDASGAFSISNVPKKFTLSAKKEKYAASEGEEVQVDPAGAKSGIVLKLRTAHFIAGKVSDADGKPVKDVHISANGRSGGGSGSAQSDENGRYRIEELAEGTYYVNAWNSGGGGGSAPSKQNIPVDRDDVDFVFGEKQGVTMIGMVVDDKTGAPIKDFNCNYSQLKKDKAPGKFTVTGLQAGVWHSFKIEVPNWPAQTIQVEVPKDRDTFEKEFRMGPGGTITGRIVAKADGKALAGVKIHLWGSSDSWERQQSMPLAVATSDEEGMFSVGPAPAGKNSLVIKPELPLATINKDVDVKNTETADVGDIPLGGGGTVRVRVVRGLEEAPVPGVALALREQNNYEQSKTGTTAEDGAYTFANLSPTRYSVQSTKPNIYASADVKEEETKEVVLRLGSGKLIGKALKGGSPVVVSASISQGGSDQSQSRSVQGAPDGSFVLEDLLGGTFQVSLNLVEDYNVRLSESVDIPETGGAVEKTFVFPNGSISGTVTDNTGQPVNGVRVAITPPQTGTGDLFATNRGGQNKMSDVKGSFTFNGLKAGSYAVTASKADVGMANQPAVQVTDSGETRVDLKLEQSGGSVESIVLDIADGKPIQRAWCYLNGPSGFLDHGATRGPDGIMKITNVPPGSYKVQVSAWSYSSNEKTIEVTAGQTTRIEDVLYGAGSMRWILKDKAGKPVADVSITVVPVDSGSMESPRDGKTDAQGQFTARGLAPGQYTATAQVTGRAPLIQTFTIKAASHDEKTSVLE